MVIVDEEKPSLKSAEKNWLAGGIAGCVAKTITAPLSRLTVLYQVGPLLSSHFVSSSNSLTRVGVSDSLLTTAQKILRTEGVFSFWRGNFTSAVIHRFPYSAIQFSSYEALKTSITHHSEGHDSVEVRFGCGAISGATACISCYPLDIIRTRLTITNAQPTARIGVGRIMGLLLDIVASDGLRGLYRGLTATLAVTMPTMGISFAVYGYAKAYLLKEGYRNERTGHLSAMGSLCAGSVSGVISASSTFPLDVIRKRMQVMGAVEKSSSSSSSLKPHFTTFVPTKRRGMHSMWSHIQDIAAREGPRGFYRGLLPEVLKVCPTVAIMFCTYEVVKDRLDQAW